MSTLTAVPSAQAASPAASVPELTVDGLTLRNSSQPNGKFTVAVNAPLGATVKFKMDGNYLGQDKSWPYHWIVDAGPGNHKLEARWDLNGQQKTEAPFAVGAAPAPATAPAPAIAPAPAPAPVPAPAPAPAPVSASTGTVNVSTSSELTAALRNAQPGQTIHVNDGKYVGKFEASASGTASAPITLTGSRAAILTTGNVASGYGLHVTGSQWRISGISVAESGKGIVLDGSRGTVIRSVDVGKIGSEAVHFRQNSSDGEILDSEIHDTGLSQPAYGEGVYAGSATSNWASIMGSSSEPDRSDRVLIKNNRITNTSAEGVDIKEGTTGGSVVGNVFSNAGYSGANSADSWVDIKGNGYTVTGNSGSTAKLDAFQVHSVMTGWGRDNHFSGNTVVDGVPGYEVWIQSASLGNTVTCASSPAKLGLTNIPCSP